MKKLCPYCGRAGELGTACTSCGYVLSENDKDVPEQKIATNSSNPAKNIQINISTTNTYTSTFTTPTASGTPRIAPQTVTKPDQSPISYYGLWAGLGLIVFGIVAFVRTFAFIDMKDFVNAYVLMTIALCSLFGGIAASSKAVNGGQKSKIRTFFTRLCILMAILIIAPILLLMIVFLIKN